MHHYSAEPDWRAGVAPRPMHVQRLRRLVLGLGALAVLAVLAGTALSLWRMQREMTQRAEEHLHGLVQILGEQSLRSVHAVDAVLRAAADDAKAARGRDRPAAYGKLHRQLRDILAHTPYVHAVMLTDADGKLLVHTTRFPPPPHASVDSEAFRAHRDRGQTQREPDRPLIGKVVGERNLNLSRRLSDPHGRFLGIVSAEVDPAYLLGPQGLHELGPDGAARLLRSDGTLLTGYPVEVVAATRNYRNSALFTQGVAAGRTLIRHAGVVVAGERISAIHRIEGYPLAITVTSSVDFVLRDWYRSAALLGIVAGLTAVFLGLITWTLARQLRIDEELKSLVTGSEERLHAIIQSAMDAIITVDDRQRILLFNAAAQQIFRCPGAEAIGTDIGRFVRGPLLEQQPEYSAEFDDAGAPMSKLGQHLALTGVRAGGYEFPIDASVSRVRLQGARLYIVILRDVTERKQIEAALRANEQRYRTLFSKATDGILLLDTEGNIVDVNDAFARTHGYTIDELLKMNLGHLDTPETLALAPERIRRILRGETAGFEVEHYHKDRHILPMDVATSAIDIDGKSYVLAFHRDITERRRAEQALRRSQQELRGLSKAANEALEAERRRTARELHDELGQSLTALKMDLESLHAALPPGQPDLEGRVESMHELLDGTIAATRRIAADLRPLMLDDLGLAAALDWLTHSFSTRTGIATDLVIDDTVAQVPEPIASALYRITQESLTNVARYAQATTAEIRLERDGDQVRLLVRDNGRGIEPAEQDKRGTFGLLGIRERVTLLGGEVAIKGTPGQGSEVCARIPLASARAPEAVA